MLVGGTASRIRRAGALLFSNALFLQGWQSVFLLALYVISCDPILGVTGPLSFGHVMFFAVGARTFGIAMGGPRSRVAPG